MFFQKTTVALGICAMALGHGAAWSQDAKTGQASSAPDAVAAVDGKALVERLMRPTGGKGIVALVFDEKGEVIAMTREGRTLPPCKICTPELERQYGPGCGKARKASELKTQADDQRALLESRSGTPLVCDKMVGTTIEDVSPISAIKHTGSQCISFFFNTNGQAQVYQYCW